MKETKQTHLQARNVAEYLLSLDPNRKYFTLKRMPEKEG